MVQGREQDSEQKKWVVTGAAGFIGFHLVNRLLKMGQVVYGVDNFITGKRERLDALAKQNTPEALKNFEFVEGDLQDIEICRRLCRGTAIVLHHAAIGSVPESIANPLATHANNVNTFVNMTVAAKEAGVERFVYASSSSVYGDDPHLPKMEGKVGKPLSPYAATKQMNELYAQTIQKNYGIETIGLRYFNVFGPWQDPCGPYAAVIPLWIRAFLQNEPVHIFGDGLQSRDFCYVSNVVEANVLAARAPRSETGRAYNIGCGQATSLVELYRILRDEVLAIEPKSRVDQPIHLANRAGDIVHSVADIQLAKRELGFEPSVHLREGLRQTLAWYRGSR